MAGQKGAAGAGERDMISTQMDSRLKHLEARLPRRAGRLLAMTPQCPEYTAMAEGVGVEPTIPFGIPALQAGALGRYATPP